MLKKMPTTSYGCRALSVGLPKVATSAANSEMSDAALAKRFNRTGKCARYITYPAARAAHVTTCESEKDRNGKDLFPTRMGKVRGLVENSKKALVNDSGESKTK